MRRRKHFFNFIFFMLGIGMLCGCSSVKSTSEWNGNHPVTTIEQGTQAISESTREEKNTENLDEKQEQDTSETQTDALTEIDLMLEQMTLREKVGQMFLVRPDSLDIKREQDNVINPSASGVKELTESMIEMLKDYPVGGIVMFRKNITSSEQIVSFNEELQNVTEIPLFVAIDEEGGSVSRLANHPAFDLPRYKNATTVGASGSSDEAFAMGQTIGAYLREYGFTMDFAPVADVYTNPNNTVIGTRSFSTDAKVVTQMASAMAEGLRQEKIVPVFKHFPGHGDTAEDSHKGLAVSHKTKEELQNCEWLPFEEAKDEDCIMMGHIAVPEITGDMTPASLSYDIVTEILRDEMDFQGLIITDSFEMKAIINTYTPGEAAVAAILAGNDIILSPNGLQEAFDAVVVAVEDGTVSEERIDESVRRILAFKYKQ